jgi:hypothetical protein
MKYKDLLLLSLTIIFIILSIFYIISVCNYDVKELFITRYHAVNNACEKGIVLKNEPVLNSTSGYSSVKLRNDQGIDDYNDYYNCNNNFDMYLSMYNDVNKRDLLLAYKCIKLKPSELINMITENKNINSDIFKIKNIEFLYNNISELTNKVDELIKTKINELKNTENNSDINYIHFPIYVCISQAPYLKNNSENIKVTDSNRGPDNNNYDSCSQQYTEVKAEQQKCSEKFEMKAELCIIFLGVSDIGDIIKNNDKVNNNISNFKKILDLYKSTSKQCFLNCGINNSTHSCGCLNLDNSYENYNSVCLTNNQKVSYSIVYFVNPYSSKYSDADYTNKPTNLTEFRWFGGKSTSTKANTNVDTSTKSTSSIPISSSSTSTISSSSIPSASASIPNA